jgi:nicotinamide riboside kinase
MPDQAERQAFFGWWCQRLTEQGKRFVVIGESTWEKRFAAAVRAVEQLMA